MAKKQLDLSHILAPLENEFKETLQEICEPHSQENAVFDAAIEDFIAKYGGSCYRNLDDLLATSALEAANSLQNEPIPLDILLKDLLE